MERLNDHEIEELHDILSIYVHYGDDNIVYTEAGDTARSILRKVNDEARARKFWWAQR